jgi:hypothetical protein
MPFVRNALELYQQLADWYEQRGQAQMRDRFLVLAADSALSSGNADMAERLRSRLLQQNPHHLLKPYGSFAEAMKAPDVQSYVADLRRSYSPEAAEHLLESLRAQGGEPQPPAAPKPIIASPLPSQTEPAKETPEVLQFYRIHEEVEEDKTQPVPERQVPVTGPLPPSRQPAAPQAAPPPPARKPAAGPPPAPPQPPPARKVPRAPAASPFATEPLPAALSRRPTRAEQDLATGFWVSTLLFAVVLLAGLGLAAFTLARPFLPAEWFR